LDLSRREYLPPADLDRPEEAEQAFLEAAAGWHGVGLRHELRCLWGSGESARLASADDRARRHLLRAQRLALRHGLQPMLGRIRGSLRAIGTPRATRRSNGAAVLTRRELAVLELVGEGMSSREIGARLALSRRTVDSVVKSSMAKLGVTTRGSAAVKAAASGG
jgi:DNA-binding CsgD family transcriptional regulator